VGEKNTAAIAGLRLVLKLRPAEAQASASTSLSARETEDIDGGEDNYDYVVEMITDVRSTHGNIINNLLTKVIWPPAGKSIFANEKLHATCKPITLLCKQTLIVIILALFFRKHNRAISGHVGQADN
jgi:hypothetical protein